MILPIIRFFFSLFSLLLLLLYSIPGISRRRDRNTVSQFGIFIEIFLANILWVIGSQMCTVDFFSFFFFESFIIVRRDGIFS